MVIVRSGEHQREASSKQGVRQRCSLSPLLFNGYNQRGLHDVREEIDNRADIRVHAHKIDLIRFTDDIAVVGGKGLDNMNDFVYLGNRITSYGCSKREM